MLPLFLLIIVVPVLATFTALAGMRRPLTPKQRATLMMTLGIGLVAFAVAAMFVSGEPAVAGVSTIGIVFIAVGARQLRTAA